MVDKAETPILNNEDFKTALRRLWIAEYECRSARQELAKVKKQIMEPIAALKNDIKVLQPKLASFMDERKMTHVRCDNRVFTLRSRTSTPKIDVKTLCDYLSSNNDDDKITLSTLRSAVKPKTTHRVIIPNNKDEKLVDL